MLVDPEPTSHSRLMDAIVGSLLVMTQLGTVWVAHLKGKKGAKTQSEGMDTKLRTLGDGLRMAIDNRCDLLTQEVSSVSGEVKDLKHTVVGVNGENGIRGELRELKAELRELAPRRLARSKR